MRQAARVWALAPVAAAALYAQTGQTGSGSLSGSVLDARTNRGLGGAYVTAKYSGLPPLARTVKSGADGSFQVTGLPAGAYSLCVQMPGGMYLDPCQWLAAPLPGRAASAATVRLNAGQQLTGQVVRLQAGTVVRARVNDPGRRLAAKTKEGRDPHLLIGVWGPDGFYPMRKESSDGAGATYAVTAPAEARVRFAIASRHLELADESGKAVPAAGTAQDVQLRSGEANPKSFVYTITGVKP